MVDDNNSIMDLRRRQQLMRQSFFAARIVILSVVMAATSVQTTRLPRYLPQRPEHRNDPRIARGIIYHHLGGPERQFYDLFRMSKEVFVALRDWMFSNTHLRDTRYQTVEQKLLIFIWILAYNEPQRNTAARFRIAQSSVCAIVADMVPRFIQLFNAFVKMPPNNFVDPTIEFSPQLQYLTGAIGAVDGTLLHAHIPLDQQRTWRCRKGWVAQNVFAAALFDGTFCFVLAGAEGSTNDQMLLAAAYANGFNPPEGRYFLADAGFTMRPGIVTTFPDGVRYHLEDWRNAGNPPVTRKELWNLRHSRARICIEKIFGILKRKWKIVRSTAPEYPVEFQIDLTYVVTGLHNFVTIHSREDPGEPDFTPEDLEAARARADRAILGRSGEEIRFESSVRMWRGYERYMRSRAESE